MMPINAIAPPVDAADLVARYVRSLALARGTHFMDNAQPGELEQVELVAPHRVYSLSFDSIYDRQLSRAAFVGWRFLILTGERVIASAEVLNGGEPSVAVNTGESASATANAIDRLENLPEVRGGDFELRLLRINALYLAAIWLAGDQQIVIPLDPAPRFIYAGKQYTERTFFEALDQPGIKPFTGTS
jgi:hypothetical protein